MADDEAREETNEEPEADGYYGDDEVDGEELDLSFLDEEDAGDEADAKHTA